METNTTHIPGHLRSRRTIGACEVQVRRVTKSDGFAGERFIQVLTDGSRFLVLRVVTRTHLASLGSITWQEIAAAV